MKAIAKQQPVGPILVTWTKMHDPNNELNIWFCEDSTGARLIVEAPDTAKMRDVEEFLASGPEFEIMERKDK